MVSSFSSPDCNSVQKFTRGSLLVPKEEKSKGLLVGSSGRSPAINPASTESSGFVSEGGSGLSVVKNEKINEPRGLSFGPGPGISMSSPRVMNEGAWLPPQSDVTKP